MRGRLVSNNFIEGFPTGPGVYVPGDATVVPSTLQRL